MREPRICIVGGVIRAAPAPLVASGYDRATTAVDSRADEAPLWLRVGGPSAVQAVVAARLGASVQLVGAPSVGEPADELIESFRREGVDCTHLRRPPGQSAPPDARPEPGAPATRPEPGVDLTEAGAATAAVSQPSDDAAGMPSWLAGAKHALEVADCVLPAGDLTPQDLAAVLRLTRACGPRVVWRAGAVPIPAHLLRLVDVLVLDPAAAAALSGVDPDDAARSTAWLHALGPPVVIVTRSGGGALVSATDGSQAIGARHPAVRDSALRADIFMAALAVELASGRGAVRATQTAEVVRVLARLDRARDMALPSAAEIERVRRAHYTGHLEPRRAGSSDRGGG